MMYQTKQTSSMLSVVFKKNTMLIIFVIMIMNSEGKLICSPDRTSESCQWFLFGWDSYHGCGYKQKMNKHLCIIKNLDGSKSTFLTRLNLSLDYQYCLEFKYLSTGSNIDCCMNFYGKTWTNRKNQSKLFSTFCISNKQIELFWYSFSVLLPENITMINVVTESNGIASNHSLIIKDLSIQQCDQMSTLSNILLINSTIISPPLITKKTFWIRYRWIFFISILILFLLSFIIITIILYISRQTSFHQQSTIIERIPIPSINLSQHFYEEPISIILQPPLEISVYDHVRDNYV